jgi:tRNA(fMet)-specific endonuclease VapC
MTSYMLDTDISSYVIKRRPEALADIFEKRADTLCISVMTAAELRFGAEKLGRASLVELVEAYIERLAVLDWTANVTHHYATIRSTLERAGTPIGNMDLLIAAHAVAQGLTLVTNNIKHFAHVPKLKTEVWASLSE